MTAQRFIWNADQYGKFIDERTRPAIELLSRVDLTEPVYIYDLGCGPGNSTVLLKGRWPDAHVVGIDNSESMLASARKDYPDIEFLAQDIAAWSPNKPADIIFSNAAFQWLPDHEKLLPQLASHLKPGGVLAMQMPHNQERPTHTSMRAVALEHNWSVDLRRVQQIQPILDARIYYDVLNPYMHDIDIWETEYFHIMDSVDAIVEWFKGTGLRPFLEALGKDEQQEFLNRYAARLKAHFKPQTDGKVLLPFPRLFLVARKNLG
jgi:trans-aconitate 2-methyltransferase